MSAVCPFCDTEKSTNKDGRIRRHSCPPVDTNPVQTIPLPWGRVPISQNSLRRTHYLAEAKLKAVVLSEARCAIRNARPTPVQRLDIIRLCYRPATNQLRDADGLAPTGKCVTDALVKEGVIPGDDFRHVSEAAYRIYPPMPGLPGSFWLELVPFKEAS